MKKNMVKVKNTLLGDGIPKICVPLVGRTGEELQEQAAEAARVQPDLVEWRVDYYEEIRLEEERTQTLRRLADQLDSIPLLFTFRTSREGGNCGISVEEYEALNLWAAEQPEVQLVDIEGRWPELAADHLVTGIQKKGCPVVASSHYFHRTPAYQEMQEILQELQRTGAEVLKLAVMPSRPQEVLDLLQVTLEMNQKLPNPLITMSMGKMGGLSRVSGALMGSAVTFAAMGESSAPGQLPLGELRRMLKLLD